jgi:tRNA A-37 threonylcarbamoyl transferase component Bud32
MKDLRDPSPPLLDIAAAAEAALRAHPARVQRIEVAGRGYWVKAQERLDLKLWLQKGNAARALGAERSALAILGKAGAPVPQVVAEGEGWFVTPDLGPSLTRLLKEGAPDRVQAFRAAGAALTEFHRRGLSHGRPSIKDICWDGTTATFIDFERFAHKRNTLAGHAQDVVILLFSALAETGHPCPETDALAEGYRGADPGGIWERAKQLCRRLAFMDLLTRPIQLLPKSREFRAIPLTLKAFGVR